MDKVPFLITYYWESQEEADFHSLADELDAFGVPSVFESIAISKDRELWGRLGDLATRSGWGYLVTPKNLTSKICRTQQAQALRKVHELLGHSYPLIALLQGVRIYEVPAALKPAWCVSPSSPQWKEEVKARLEGRNPEKSSVPVTQYVWRIYPDYASVAGWTAVEIRPRYGEIRYWQFAVPDPASICLWGHGPAGGGAIAARHTAALAPRQADINGQPVTWYGAGDHLSPETSAYIVFEGSLPDFICFGFSIDGRAQPRAIEVYRLR